ncbi:MAG: hypothetical protein FWD05_10625 [Oscillospiraceae bacterium]|nr:hypothetical protein [Oscillospiraceae bacterium]
MNIIFHEIKKIWNLKIMIVIVVLCTLFFYMNMQWFVRHAQVNTSVEAVFTRELAERYGTRMTQEQWDNFFDESFTATIAELEYQIRQEPSHEVIADDGSYPSPETSFANLGIYSYVDLMQAFHSDKLSHEEFWQLSTHLNNLENMVFIRFLVLNQMQDVHDSWRSQIDMQGEMERYGYNEWFFATLSAAIESSNVLEMVAEMREPLVYSADEFIAHNPLFAENNITTYEQFVEMWDDTTFISFEHYRARLSMWRTLLGPSADFVERKIGILYMLSQTYKDSLSHEMFVWDITWHMDVHERRVTGITPLAQQRIDSIIENREDLNIMYFGTFWNTTTYFGHINLISILAVLTLILPLITVDRMRNLQSVQYSSKLGRRILFKQIAAVLLSAFVLTTLLLTILGGIYFYATNVLMYWNHNIYSVSTQVILIDDFTFGQYLIILTILTYIITLGASMFAFVVSRYSRNLISAIIKIIPVFAALAFFNNQLNHSGVAVPLSPWHRFYQWTHIPYIEVIACAALLILSLVLAIWVTNRAKRTDLV